MRSAMRRNGGGGGSSGGSSGGWTASPATRTPSNRLHGRITKQDIRSAGFRRWDGRARITTDWVNVFQEPELWFADGDVLVYLREPGQSSRGPAFRVHKDKLREKGFDTIVSKCIDRAPIPSAANCMAVSCPGCQHVHPMSELYVPAPQHSDMDMMFDHHITTRNFFAWLYNLPLAGRTLGWSMIALKGRIDFYRPATEATTGLQVVSYAESQRYLDFRECLDHALAALLLAEVLQLEDLWVDAFAHCVGMSHRDLKSSVEYPAISEDTKIAIKHARADMDIRLERLRNCLTDFFEYTLSENVLGLPATAREHFDRFRSWLHSFYIEKYGFWPPLGFLDDAVQRDLYVTMYSDFRNLYHHLADSNTSAEDGNLSTSGGVCALQTVQAFDQNHHYEALPNPLPLTPRKPDTSARPFGLQRRKSWNPLTKRRIERDARNAMRMQSLITASNRDWRIMECLLVRRYSEFEVKSVVDESETISMVDGRKVRWILVYAVLQMLISVMQAPAQVRNTDGLTYSLCCRVPQELPWHSLAPPSSTAPLQRTMSTIEPDTDPLRTKKVATNIEPDADLLKSTAVVESTSSTSDETKRGRRLSLPSRLSSTSLRNSFGSTASRPVSLRRFMSKRASNIPDVPSLTKPPAYCEILVHGYGNGLNEANVVPSPTSSEFAGLESPRAETFEDEARTSKVSVLETTAPKDVVDQSPNSPTVDQVPELTPATSTSVSRESSNASNKESSWTKSTNSSEASAADDNTKTTTPNDDAAKIEGVISEPTRKPKAKPEITLQELLAATRLQKAEMYDFSQEGEEAVDDTTTTTTNAFEAGHNRFESRDFNKILDEKGYTRTVHMTTSTWDQFLGMS